MKSRRARVDSAQFNLATSYADGEGVEQDHILAIKWYTKAADQGLATAQYALARAYFSGEGVKSDKVKAVALFKKSAEQGDELAIYVLKQLGIK